MRRAIQALAAFGLLSALAQPGWAAEDEAAKIIDKAVKAHFPKGLDVKNTGSQIKTKGKLHIMGLDLEFNQEVSIQAPDKFKEVMAMTVMGNNVVVTSVYNGKEAWIRAGDTDVPVNDEILAEFKEASYVMGLVQGALLKDKSLKVSVVGEAKVKDKPALGVMISRKGNKDVTVYFDKETGLIAKVEMRRRDLMAGQEVNEERIIAEYQEVDGRKMAKKVEVLRDGKAFLEAEVIEVKLVEKLDDSEFAQPK
jgi:outer membrane lipoprotein-sorting protein